MVDRVEAAAPGNGLTLVSMRFNVADEEEFLQAAARFVVLARGHAGCRNIDLCRSVSAPGSWTVLEKWSSPEAQRQHLDHPDTITFAQACSQPGVLAGPPALELLEGASAHDLA